MKIDYASDLHLDNAMRGGPHGWLGRTDIAKWSDGGDVLVVAGDTAEHIDDTIDLLNGAQNHYPVVIGCLGNHETGAASKSLRDRVFLLDWLDDRRIDHDGIAFIGGCLSPADRDEADRLALSINGAASEVAVREIVAITHYPPSWRLATMLGRRIEEACSPMLEEVQLARDKPITWVCGHLHYEFDLDLDGIRIVSNPRGYRELRRDGSAWKGFKSLLLRAPA